MRSSKLLLTAMLVGTLTLLSFLANAQISYIPEEPWDEPLSSSHFYYANYGQMLDTKRKPADDVGLYTLNTPYHIWVLDDRISVSMKGQDTVHSDSTYRVDMSWTNPAPHADYGLYLDMATESEDHFNYYLPHLGDDGVTDVHGWGRMEYNSVAEGVHFQVYSNHNGFKCAYVVEPQGKIDEVEMTFEGQQQVWVDELGTLGIVTEGGVINLGKAEAFECDAEGKVVSDTWTPILTSEDDERVEIDPGSYNTDNYLVIVFAEHATRGANEPVDNVGWSSYWGGEKVDQFQAIASNASNFYIAGSTQSPNFPAVTGSNSTNAGLGFDVMILKVDDDIKPQWGTFIGGDIPTGLPNFSGARDEPTAIEVDANGDVFVAGFTESTDFPMLSSGSGYYDDVNDCNGSFCTDAFLLKLNYLNGLLEWSTFYGGDGSETFEGMELDADGNIYCVGDGDGNTPLETLTGAYNEASKGSGLIVKFDNTGDRLWATRFGSSNNQDLILDIQSDNAGGMYLCGETRADGFVDFPVIDPGVTPIGHLTPQGGKDGFIARLNGKDDLHWSYYVGGNLSGQNGGADILTAMDRNGSHNVIAVGHTTSQQPNFAPLQAAGSSAYFKGNRTIFNGGDLEAFLVETDTNGQVIWGTYFGTNGNEEVRDVHVASDGVVYVGGKAQGDSLAGSVSPAFGFFERSSTSGTPQLDEDGFIMAFSNTRQLIWKTYYGSGGLDALGNPTNGNVIESISALATTNANTLYTLGNTFNGTYTDFILVDYDPNSVLDYFQSTPALSGDISHAWGARFDVGGIQAVGVALISEDLKSLHVFPNPATQSIYVAMEAEGNAVIEVYDQQGRLVLVKTLDSRKSEQNRIDIHSLDAGIYILKERNSGEMAKFVVSR